MSNSSKLRELINNADGQAEDIDNSVTQIDTQLTELQSQHDAIREGLLDVITGDMTSYLEITKIVEVGGSFVAHDPDFGDSTVTTFYILDSTGGVLYEYEGIGWDSDAQIIDWVDKFDFGYDYLVHPLGITGTYGINDKITQLQNAKNLLTQNKTKVVDSKTVFEDYAG
jgi:hypothetical protein